MFAALTQNSFSKVGLGTASKRPYCTGRPTKCWHSPLLMLLPHLTVQSNGHCFTPQCATTVIPQHHHHRIAKIFIQGLYIVYLRAYLSAIYGIYKGIAMFEVFVWYIY